MTNSVRNQLTLNQKIRVKKLIICLLIGVIAPIVLAIILNQAIADTEAGVPEAPAEVPVPGPIAMLAAAATTTTTAVPASAAPTTAPAAQPAAQAGIYDILISDQANSEGYVLEKKTPIPVSASSIYVTVQVTSAQPGMKVSTKLISLTASVSASLESEVSKAGNIMKAFVFRAPQNKWPAGQYRVEVKLSNGAVKDVEFAVQ